MTFSLLPDFLASRLSGTLDEVEQVVCAVEAARSVEAAADELRVDIELPGAVRWVRRRLLPIRGALVVMATLMPGMLPSTLELRAVRAHLATEHALMDLRALADKHPPASAGHSDCVLWRVAAAPAGAAANTKRGLTPEAESRQSASTARRTAEEVR